jgi:signal transduction histidine kinase
MRMRFAKVRNKKSISAKLFRLVFGLYCIAALIITVFHLGYDYFSIKEQMRQSIILYQHSLEKTLAKEIWHLDRTKNKDTMEGIVHLPFVVGASIYLADGCVFTRIGTVASSGRADKLWDAETSTSTADVPVSFSDDLFVHSFDLFDRSTPEKPEIIGRVHFYSSSAAIIHQLQSLFASIVIASLFKTSILWMIFIFVIDRKLGRPLQRLVEFVDKLPMEGNREATDEKKHLADINELELLEETLGQMSQKLIQTLEALRNENLQHQITAKHLQEVNEMIESAIMERTCDLEITNSNLLLEIASRKKTEAELAAKNEQLSQALDDLKHAQSTILQQDKMASIGQLAAGVAHEINNPMGFILSNLNTLEKYLTKLGVFLQLQTEALLASTNGMSEEFLCLTAEVERQRKQLKIDFMLGDIGDLIHECLDGGQRVKTIVQNLKRFARLDEEEWKVVDIIEGLESTLSIVWNEIKYKAEVKKEYGAIPSILCNIGQLNQVFMNLLVNAAQAIEGRGEIRITTRCDADDILIEIADTGCGIPHDQLNRIFEPFFTTKEVGKGTGLGLSITYDIIKQHGGEISATSGWSSGRGTIFTIRLPIKSTRQGVSS